MNWSQRSLFWDPPTMMMSLRIDFMGLPSNTTDFSEVIVPSGYGNLSDVTYAKNFTCPLGFEF